MSNQSTPPKGKRKAPVRVPFTEELAEAICAKIRVDGVSDSRAGLLAGATPQAIALWKKREPHFAEKLQRARAEFQRERLAQIRAAAGRDGAIDWRAQAWLAEHAGTSSGLGDEDEPEESSETKTPTSPLFAVTSEQLDHLQQRRTAALTKANHEQNH